MEAFKSDSQQLCELRFSSPQSLFSGSPVIFRGRGFVRFDAFVATMHVVCWSVRYRTYSTCRIASR